MKPFTFSTELKWIEGKKGVVSFPNNLKIEISTPPEFKGPQGFISPEELFLASIDSCILTTFLYFVEKAQIHLLSYQSKIEGEVIFKEGKLKFEKVKILPQIKVEKGELEKVKIIMEKTKNHCLISNSLNCEIILSPEIKEGG
ncbi:OsmC family protein [Candidatus Calescamantes bacterium]|nr:OsmC family protein [Candidatus Calescamantes bacterium]